MLYKILSIIYLLIIASISLASVATAEDIDDLTDIKCAMQHIKSIYIKQISSEILVRAAIEGMLTLMDEYSTYFTHEELEKMNTEANGEYVGIGIRLTQKNERIVVNEVTKSSPADTAGIMVGDYIDSINDIKINEPEAMSVFGKLGSVADIAIIRENELGVEKKIFRIERSLVHIPTVQSTMLPGDIALLKIAYFSKQTTDDLRTAWANLSKNDVKGIIMDLRDNSGGLLEQAVSVSDAFLEQVAIVHVKDREMKTIKTYRSSNNTINLHTPMVVIVNEYSASGAEIVAGALQDNRRALIVGVRTYGKGLMQKIIDLPASHGAIKLTTAALYTPNNQQIQNTGITPDILALKDEQFEKAQNILNIIIKMRS